MDLKEKAEAVLAPLDRWALQCHAASVELVRSGEFGTCRVARGACIGVGGQLAGKVRYEADKLIARRKAERLAEELIERGMARREGA